MLRVHFVNKRICVIVSDEVAVHSHVYRRRSTQYNLQYSLNGMTHRQQPGMRDLVGLYSLCGIGD